MCARELLLQGKCKFRLRIRGFGGLEAKCAFTLAKAGVASQSTPGLVMVQYSTIARRAFEIPFRPHSIFFLVVLGCLLPRWIERCI